MTADAIARLEAGTLQLLAAVERGECELQPAETCALISLLCDARLLALGVRVALTHAAARPHGSSRTAN